LTIT